MDQTVCVNNTSFMHWGLNQETCLISAVSWNLPHHCCIMKLASFYCCIMKLASFYCYIMKLASFYCYIMKLASFYCCIMKLASFYCCIMKLAHLSQWVEYITVYMLYLTGTSKPMNWVHHRVYVVPNRNIYSNFGELHSVFFSRDIVCMRTIRESLQ